MDQDEGCLSEDRSEFPSFPLFMRSAVNPQGALLGSFLFGSFILAEQNK